MELPAKTGPGKFLHREECICSYCYPPHGLATIESLKSRIESLESEKEQLRKQLPKGMENCTIVSKKCKLGHGWLTATNWVHFDCPTCERDELRRKIKELEEKLNNSGNYNIESKGIDFNEYRKALNILNRNK